MTVSRPATAGELIEEGANYLKEKGIGECRLNSEWLMSFALDKPRLSIKAFPSLPVSDEIQSRFMELIRAKGGGTPLSYITGSHNFLGSEVTVNSDVLIPRPETEGLVELALKLLGVPTPPFPKNSAPSPFSSPLRGEEKNYNSSARQDAEKISPAPLEGEGLSAEALAQTGRGEGELKQAGSLKILDMGTGSGCIACALALRLANAKITAADISRKALDTAEANAGKLGVLSRVQFVRTDLFENIGGMFDMIISNPPYIPAGEIKSLEREVSFEPVLALDGGCDGMACIRRITAGAAGFLKPAGWLVLETGAGQAKKALELLDGGLWRDKKTVRDIFGLDRYIFARLANG